MSMTCQHKVPVGTWCRYCGTVVDTDLVRALAFVPALPVDQFVWNPSPRTPERVLGSVTREVAAGIAKGINAPLPVPTRDPDIERFEENLPVMAGECGNCHRPVLVSAAGWTRCNCGSETTVLR